MEPQPKSNNKFAPEQTMSAEEWERIHRPMGPVDETVRQVIEDNNLECAKIYEISKKVKKNDVRVPKSSHRTTNAGWRLCPKNIN
jgi:hypothetical protein